jgi:pimeloyl-ACP methyl ester carboxylesterase
MRTAVVISQLDRLGLASNPVVPPLRILLGSLTCAAFMLASLPAWPQAGGGAASDPSGPRSRTAEELPTLPLPTLGGRQLWQDVAYHAGWRVQRHVWTGHQRLLDPDGWRRAWGGASQVRKQFEAVREDPAISPSSDHLVVLVHGWGRTQGMFAEMEEALVAEGYDVLRLAYPSTRLAIAEHAAALTTLISDLQGVREVSFVTHSLGGIVLRKMLATRPGPESAARLHRAVLIAAPNQGAQLAEELQGFDPFHWIGGPVAAELTPERLAALPAPSLPFITIAGARNTAEGWNPLIPGDDDGVVALAETRLKGAEAHHVVSALHTFIVDHPKTIAITRAYLAQPR